MSQSQLTLNPVTKEWEELTPHEWALLKAGYPKHAEIPEWKIQFKVDMQTAFKQYSGCCDVTLTYYLGLMIGMGALDVDKQYGVARFINYYFFHEEILRFYGPIFAVRNILNEINKHNKDTPARTSKRTRRLKHSRR